MKETCDAIYGKLAPIYLTTRKEDRLKIAKDFEELWNLLNVIGALGDKRICIQCIQLPQLKRIFQFTFTCCLQHSFTITNIGQYGSNNGNGVFKNSELERQLESGEVKLPSPRTANGCSFDSLPYTLDGEEMMGPFLGNLSEKYRVCNLRLDQED